MKAIEKQDVKRVVETIKCETGTTQTCVVCSSTMLIPSGTCKVCMNCGSTTGCS